MHQRYRTRQIKGAFRIQARFRHPRRRPRPPDQSVPIPSIPHLHWLHRPLSRSPRHNLRCSPTTRNMKGRRLAVLSIPLYGIPRRAHCLGHRFLDFLSLMTLVVSEHLLVCIGMPHYRKSFAVYAEKVCLSFLSESMSVCSWLPGLSRHYWMEDENCKECYDCKSEFTTWRRKHHCRICGQ